MKNLSRFFVGAAALVLLTACGPSKVSYEKFHEKAVAALNDAKEKKFDVTLKGTYKDDDGEHKMDNVVLKWNEGAFAATNITHLDEVGAAVILNLLTANLVGEDENITYYAGNGFKTVKTTDDGSVTTTWNKYALPTAVKGGGSSITASYKQLFKYLWKESFN